MTLIWGSNFSLVKAALHELPQLGFNALRMLLAAALCVALVARDRNKLPWSTRFNRREWHRIVALAIIGHLLYQFLFIGGLARTSASNSSLIFGCTPVTIAVVSAWLGHERITPVRWAGVLLSLIGIYLVVGHARQGGASLAGDVLTVFAMLAWTVYTIGSRSLLEHHSALVVTGYTMAIGGVLYVPFGVPSLVRLQWSAVSAGAWLALVYSSVFSLVVAYLIWYTAVQQVGSSKTSIYQNGVPLVAMLTAAMVLGEPITFVKLAGATAVIAGVVLTRLEPAEAVRSAGEP
jgi:drug/metabolite transporter (DMT)-like permease